MTMLVEKIFKCFPQSDILMHILKYLPSTLPCKKCLNFKCHKLLCEIFYDKCISFIFSCFVVCRLYCCVVSDDC